MFDIISVSIVLLYGTLFDVAVESHGERAGGVPNVRSTGTGTLFASVLVHHSAVQLPGVTILALVADEILKEFVVLLSKWIV